MSEQAGNSAGTQPSKGSGSRGFLRQAMRTAWRYKKTTLFVAGVAYFALRQKQKKTGKEAKQLALVDGTVIGWRITDGSIIEAPEPQKSGMGWITKLSRLLSGTSHEITMLDALMALEMAADDPRVKSLVVKMGPGPGAGGGSENSVSAGLGIAQIQELRQALATFKEKKEKQLGQGSCRTYFYTDSFDDQATYYLASAFTDIIVQPTGYVPLTGISSTQLYFKDLTDKLGVKVHVEARKEYKSVVAPFSQSSMPEKHRENMLSILNSLNDAMISDIAHSRKSYILAKDKAPTSAADIVRRAMEEGPLVAPDAVNIGLLTDMGYSMDIASIIGPRKMVFVNDYAVARRTEILTKEMGVKDLDDSSLSSTIANTLTSADMRAAKDALKLLDVGTPITVGVVYLLGGIERYGPRGANSVSQSLFDAAKDPSVSAIVLRIDSGGGDVIASDKIGAMVDHVQATFGKPVIASYGNVSASGAYYASTSCKRIFASPGTITGSIGVASMRPIFTKKLLEYLGTNVEELYIIDNKSNSTFTEPQGDELERYRKSIDKIYSDFTDRVANGRGFTPEKVESVARGQVFTGLQALENGLVDELGGFTRAVESAAQFGFDARVDITSKLVQFYATRIQNSMIRKAVTSGTFKSIDDAAKSIVFKVTVDSPPIHDVPESQIETVSEGVLKDTKYQAGSYKADILKNVRVKIFPEAGSLAKTIISRFSIPGSNDDGDDGDNGESGLVVEQQSNAALANGFVRAQIKSVAADAMRSAITDEIEQILTQKQPPLSSTGHSSNPRYESDTFNVK
ncbi:hypothetical protein GGI12_001954 [Dipsacomyces acuminosporus]|nr:hypothetical protein GGI12_001954 [Dipsacomyces acuminosporus]